MTNEEAMKCRQAAQLYRQVKQENERLFIGGDLTGYDGFTIQHKNYK